MAWLAVAGVAAGVATVLAQRQDDVEQVRARQKNSMMEAVLQRAVANGADNMLRQMRNVMADAPMLTGAPQVRGFRLEGFGVFFDVNVPEPRIPLSWPLRQIVEQTGLAAS